MTRKILWSLAATILAILPLLAVNSFAAAGDVYRDVTITIVGPDGSDVYKSRIRQDAVVDIKAQAGPALKKWGVAAATIEALARRTAAALRWGEREVRECTRDGDICLHVTTDGAQALRR